MQSSINNFRHSLSFNYSNEVEKSFSNFIKLVTSTINTHAPLIKASRRKRKLMNRPWITKGILVSIQRKQKSYINFFKNGTEIEKKYCIKLMPINCLKSKPYQKSFT